jgi:hypothetical protein
MQDVIEALKIEDDVLAQVERVCGRQLHRLSVEHDVLQRMLQSMPEEEENESEQIMGIPEDLDKSHEVVKVVSTKAAVAKRKPARGKKSSPSPRQTKEKKGKGNKRKVNRMNAKNSTPPVDKTKRKSCRKKP